MERRLQLGVIGDRIAGFTPHESIDSSLRHAGADVEVVWHSTPDLLADPAALLGRCDGVWCAPGSPYLSLDGAVDGIRFAREAGIPFIGTCAGFQHGVIEFARNVVGMDRAGHAEYGTAGDLIIDELNCSLVGQTLRLRLVDDTIRAWYGTDTADERYYCRFGLDERFLPELEARGLLLGGVDAADGSTRILRLSEHPYFVLTLFVPQTRSEPGCPHPLIGAFVNAMRSRADLVAGR
ncbi:MAG: glutamine amidotransferase-related protein [Acidimicrobiales bacterium]